MRPSNLKTRIFLDGGNPDETRKVINLLGFLDGQTTNPTLIAKNPEARKILAHVHQPRPVQDLRIHDPAL